MAKAQLDAVLGHIRRIAATNQAKDLSDCQLLEEFSVHQDQTAFAALVKRHGPMVLGVCRHVLHHVQDAEDAFQATFLVLARRVASIRKKEALASWLHGVAYRTAMNAKKAAIRRRSYEGKAKTTPPSSPAWDLAWREVQAILEEEIQRLPEKYRAPFVLCFWEGQTRAAVAQQLGVKEGTVWSRLTEARRRLQYRLARRGITLSAVLSAAALTEKTSTAALPALLVNPTVKAALCFAAGKVTAADFVSAEVVALAKGVLHTMLTAKLKIATSVLLAVSFVTGAGLLTRQALAGKPAIGQQPTVSPKSPERKNAALVDEAPRAKGNDVESIVIDGRVLDPEDKPFQGAKLYLWTNAAKKSADLVERATTREDGRFHFTVSKTDLRRDAKVVATAKGYGPDWLELADSGEIREVPLRLAKDDVPINGRVLDLEGRPIPGVTVEVGGLQRGDLKPWIEGRQRGDLPGLPHRIGPQVLDGPLSVTTGNDGRFRLTGFGRERVVLLEIHGANVESSSFRAITHPEAIPGLRTGHYGTYSATFDHLASLGKPIVGTVRDKATGKPLAGITVASALYHWVVGKTDEQGRYRLEGVGKAKEYTVSAEGTSYFNCTKMRIADTPALDPITVDFELERGITIQGRLLDRSTGKPIRGHVSYISSPENPNLKDFSTIGGPHVHAIDNGKTKADGSFTVLAVPGPGLLAAAADNRMGYLGPRLEDIKTTGNAILDIYHAVVPINASEDDPKSTSQDVFLEPARSIQGSVVDQDGKPLAGAIAAGLAGIPELFAFQEAKLETASFTAGGLDPKRPRSLFFIHPEKKLAKLQPVRGDEVSPLTVHLEPLGGVTGRVLDANGGPRAGLKIAVMHSYQQEDYKGLPLELVFKYPSWTKLIDGEATTDADGRFRIEGLVPGLKYHLNVKDGAEILAGYTKEGVAVESGKATELGDLKERPASEKGAKE